MGGLNSSDIVTVYPPVSSKQLGRYRSLAGLYIIRDREKVIYIGKSKDLYRGILRLFQKEGLLSHLDRRTYTFEVVFSTLRLASLQIVLKKLFKPEYNYLAKYPEQLTKYQRQQNERFLEQYFEQSRFDMMGDNQTDG